ncbi:hypothetical protein POM88_039079 [Heracleum sosnowskyi]|uniref:SWIM-type domain-containing protein n=1 Tax=Heracleum sosnowskyi TaxID=360622 RepID=A0AAD8HBL8_9APIA|nr:hypothetical protein POM88_039079 [Heracleum sosnowskyi]
MVRTRSGIEVRLTQKDNDEDEFVNEDVVEEEQMETAGEDYNAGEEEEMGANGEQMETQNKLYEVTLYYGGHFVHVPYESYTSHVKKVHNDINFENISMDELKLCFGAAIGEFDFCSVNLQNRRCSCRVWDLTGTPCAHGVTAIQKARHNVFDYVDKCYLKDTYMRCYSHCLDVIRGEDFWEDVEGDPILPPLIVKQLRGRPKKMRRREGWEGIVSSGKKTRVKATGRKMHCGLCRMEGHKRDKCPDKHLYDVQPKKTKRRQKTKQPASDPMKEVTEEVQLQEQEILTGEDEMMNETLVHMEKTQEEHDAVTNNGMKFMPTPSLRKHTSTGCTPSASTPPSVPQQAKKKTPRKSVKFFAPQGKKRTDYVVGIF